MACTAAYECPNCGGLRFLTEGSTHPALKNFPEYTKVHVCRPKDIAEKRYLEDPYAKFPAELK